jgi:hypothetical protein
MNQVTAFKANTEAGFDRLADMVTSPDAHTACLGRAFASGIGGALENWLQSERERGTDGMVILEIVATLGLQHVASVAGVVVDPEGDEILVQRLGVHLATRLPVYLGAVRAQKGGAA